MSNTTQTGKKGRKFGRHSRSGSMAAYKATNRCAINKAKRAAKQKRIAAKKAKKNVVHGAARAARRQSLQE